MQVEPFGLLVAVAVVLGVWLARRRAGEVGLDLRVATSACLWAVVTGFIGAHLYDLFFYSPGKLAADPLALFRVTDGISSFGGFLGASMGVIYCLHRRRVPFRPYNDVLVYAFTAAWIVGRLGCTVAYDHPGHLTEFFLAMPYSGSAVSHGLRHNLGLYEVFWSLALFGYFYATRHRPRVPGWYLTTFVVAYMPFRFLLDFLRAADVRYAGLTAGQYAAIVLFAVALAYARFAGREVAATPAR